MSSSMPWSAVKSPKRFTSARASTARSEGGGFMGSVHLSRPGLGPATPLPPSVIAGPSRARLPTRRSWTRGSRRLGPGPLDPRVFETYSHYHLVAARRGPCRPEPSHDRLPLPCCFGPDHSRPYRRGSSDGGRTGRGVWRGDGVWRVSRSDDPAHRGGAADKYRTPRVS